MEGPGGKEARASGEWGLREGRGLEAAGTVGDQVNGIDESGGVRSQ